MESEQEISTETPFCVADWYVDPAAGRISRQGAEIKLEPKVMSVLVYLAQHSGKVVSREKLEASVWEGVVVGYDALASTIIKLRKAFGDSSRNPEIIETVSKKGYRLIAAVSHDKQAEPHRPRAGHGYRSPNTFRNAFIYVSFALLCVLALYVLLDQIRITSDETLNPVPDQQTDKISIVVLPFTNRSVDESQDYFSDGMTDDLISDLSVYSGLRVIARRTAYIYKQRNTDIQTIARELGVNYVLDGDVRRDGNKVRMNVQLINAKSGVNIWAQRFDRQIEDIFKVQDDIRTNIINALSVTLTKEERNRTQRRYTNSFEAYDLFLQGQSSLVSRASANDNKRAQQFMEKAIEFDPDFSRAHAALALIYADAFRFDWSDDPEQTRQLALKTGKRAIELDDHSPQAHWILGYIYLFLFEHHAKAIELGQRATKLAPYDNDALTLLAVTYAFGDDPAKAKLIIQRLIKENKYYSSLVPSVLGLANFRLEKYDESLAAYDQSLLINPSRIQGNAYKAVVLYRMGNIDDAEFQVDQLYILHPDFDVNVWAARQPFKDKNIVQQMVTDLVQAGVGLEYLGSE